ncbi:MAG TPA: LysM peptidoglycan-binding domain-containing protein [Acetobacteraceae bacterium]|jgi:nucleoid-associated protein YgaU
MQPDLSSSRSSAWRPALLIVLGLAICVSVAGIAYYSYSTFLPAPPPAPAATTAGAPAPTPTGPSFDVVRINPQGSAVMAGRAAPGAAVTILDAGKAIGQTTADANGDWVFTPTTPLPPGARQLTLSERLPDGTQRQGTGQVLLSVPASAATPPLAVATADNGAPRVLSGPAPVGAGSLALGAVDYGEHGDVRLSGHAPPGASVRVYVDDQPIGTATAGSDGTWTLTPQQPIAPGPHRLRLDQLGPNGTVTARVELPFHREELAGQKLAPGSVVVQPGNSLWVLAHRTYGAGTRYTVIFQANKAEIRDPNLIYPGQVFALPAAAGTGTAMPRSSTMSR